MIYTDEELRRWWAGLSKRDQIELLATMTVKMEYSAFAQSLSLQYSKGREFSPKQLAAIRKWQSG